MTAPSLAGTLRLRIVQCAATFEVPRCAGSELLHPTTFELRGSAGTVGRGDDADVKLVGPASREVSRKHLRLIPVSREWRAHDLCSTNGTWEPVPGTNDWARLPPQIAVPLESGMTLALGADLRLRLEIIPSSAGGEPTPGLRRGPGGRSWDARIRPTELEAFAIHLLAPRRIDPRKRGVPPIEEIGREMALGRSAAYERLKQLKLLPEVTAHLGSGDAQDVANALVLAFPYLVEDPELLG